jgi:UDP-glucose 6-dehydrogenase
MNDHQKDNFIKKIVQNNNTVSSQEIAILGWAFKGYRNDTGKSATRFM